MEWDVVVAFLVGSGAVGATATWFGERLARRYEHALARTEETYRRALETRATIDLNLRELRLPAYQPLWKLTAVLPRWPRAEGPAYEGPPVTYEDLRTFSAALRDWYFDQGGWLLSHAARAAYGEVQEGLWGAHAGVLWAAAAGGPELRSGPVAATA